MRWDWGEFMTGGDIWYWTNGDVKETEVGLKLFYTNTTVGQTYVHICIKCRIQWASLRWVEIRATSIYGDWKQWDPPSKCSKKMYAIWYSMKWKVQMQSIWFGSGERRDWDTELGCQHNSRLFPEWLPTKELISLSIFLKNYCENFNLWCEYGI